MNFTRSSILLLAAIACLATSPAKATPLFFDGNDGIGFDASNPDVVALGIDIIYGASHTFLSAGTPGPGFTPLLTVVTTLVGTPTVPATPSVLDPVLATVRYTVTNTTGGILDNEHLVFTSGATLGGFPALTPEEFGIDVPGIVLVQTAACIGNPGGPCVFGAVALPLLAPGGVFEFEITHVLNDSLSGATNIPTPAMALLENSAPSVPEPATLGLIAMAALGLRRQVRR